MIVGHRLHEEAGDAVGCEHFLFRPIDANDLVGCEGRSLRVDLATVVFVNSGARGAGTNDHVAVGRLARRVERELVGEQHQRGFRQKNSGA
jgi:hypothetical protein